MDVLPCPMCGESSPFTHISFNCAVLRCNCGVSLAGASVCTMYKREEVPLALERHTYEPTLLVIIDKNNIEIPYPEHGYVGVNALAAFNLYGHTARWNRRAA